MAEYIERNAAIAVIEEKQKELCPVGMYSRHAVYGSDREKFDAWQEIIDTLYGIPAADVRPVVLCRDCIHYKPQQKSARWSSMTPMCSRSATIKMPPDGFCSFGVKREES